MKYTLFVVVFVLLGFSASAEAQGAQVDHWGSSQECQLATGAPYYTPTIMSPKPLGEGEMVAGHPSGGCFETTISDGSRAWVRFEPNRLFVWKDGKPVRVPECNNPIYGWVPFLGLRESTGVTALAPVPTITSSEVKGELTLRLLDGAQIELIRKSMVEESQSSSEGPLPTPIQDSAIRQAELTDLEKGRDRDESFFEKNKEGLIVGGLVLIAVAIAVGMNTNTNIITVR